MFERSPWALAHAAVMVSVWFVWADPATAGVTARVDPTGEAIELEIPTDVGTQKESLPLYRSGKIQYFSAGVGQVEREATYPPFSLKLVFTAGGKPFVTGVSVVLRRSKGPALVTVSGEQVTGPWLFVDLPDGTYEMTATLGGVTQQVKNIKVRRGHVLTHHIRWAEDRSPALAAQTD